MGAIGLLIWIVLGITTGWLIGHMLPRHIRLGMAQGDALAGMLGAMFGGTLFNVMIEAGANNVTLLNTLAALVGAILMLSVLRSAHEFGKVAQTK